MIEATRWLSILGHTHTHTCVITFLVYSCSVLLCHFYRHNSITVEWAQKSYAIFLSLYFFILLDSWLCFSGVFMLATRCERISWILYEIIENHAWEMRKIYGTPRTANVHSRFSYREICWVDFVRNVRYMSTMKQKKWVAWFMFPTKSCFPPLPAIPHRNEETSHDMCAQHMQCIYEKCSSQHNLAIYEYHILFTIGQTKHSYGTIEQQ